MYGWALAVSSRDAFGVLFGVLEANRRAIRFSCVWQSMGFELCGVGNLSFCAGSTICVCFVGTRSQGRWDAGRFLRVMGDVMGGVFW